MRLWTIASKSTVDLKRQHKKNSKKTQTPLGPLSSLTMGCAVFFLRCFWHFSQKLDFVQSTCLAVNIFSCSHYLVLKASALYSKMRFLLVFGACFSSCSPFTEWNVWFQRCSISFKTWLVSSKLTWISDGLTRLIDKTQLGSFRITQPFVKGNMFSCQYSWLQVYRIVSSETHGLIGKCQSSAGTVLCGKMQCLGKSYNWNLLHW